MRKLLNTSLVECMSAGELLDEWYMGNIVYGEDYEQVKTGMRVGRLLVICTDVSDSGPDPDTSIHMQTGFGLAV